MGLDPLITPMFIKGILFSYAQLTCHSNKATSWLLAAFTLGRHETEKPVLTASDPCKWNMFPTAGGLSVLFTVSWTDTGIAPAEADLEVISQIIDSADEGTLVLTLIV